MSEDRSPDGARLAELLRAEQTAMAMLDRIEALRFIAAGRTEAEIEADIFALARDEFGVTRHWHDRLVRAGPNTLATARDTPPTRTVGDDDMVFLDLGPVFADWEADVGRSYAVGDDPRKHALCRDLPLQFEALRSHLEAHPDITGADLYDFAVRSAESAGWRFGGKIAGHMVGEFDHRDWAGDRSLAAIWPANRTKMSDLDVLGRSRFWIGEIHLVSPDGAFGGFYERLLRSRTD